MKTAADIMTREVVTVTTNVTVKELASLLTTNNISGAPVVDEDGNLLGIVTQSDLIDQNKKVHIPTVASILDAFIFLEGTGRMDQEMKKIAGATVADIYSPDPVTVEEGTGLDEIATIMSEKKLHTLPVVQNGKMTGIIGKRDIIRTIIS